MADKRFIHQKNIIEAQKLLNKVVSILDTNNIPYYLDFGTLLGAVREHQFIRWDTNINLSLLNEEDYDKLPKLLEVLAIEAYDIKFILMKDKSLRYSTKQFLKKVLKAYYERKLWLLAKNILKKKITKKCISNVSAIKKENTITFNPEKFKECVIQNKYTQMRIFFKYQYEKDLYWRILHRTKKVPMTLLTKDLQKIDLYDTYYNIPNKYNDYLTYLYEDWKTPNKGYAQEDGPSMLLKDRKSWIGDRRFLHNQNREAMLKLLKLVIEKFEEYDVEYILDMGTLLGAMREGNLLPWDDDVDISLINEKDFYKIPKILDEICKQTGYPVNLYTFKQSQDTYATSTEKYVEPKEIEFTDINNYHIAKIKNRNLYVPQDVNIALDIFFTYKYKKEIHWFMFGKVYKMPEAILNKGIQKIDFHNIKCNVPVAYNKYLTQWFDNWEEPNPEWEEDDSPAMQDNYRGQKVQDNRFIHQKNKDAMIDLFKLVDKVLRKHKIAYYLDFGTLIGAVRDNGFIPWDDDMDISLVHEKDFHKLPQVVKEIKRIRFFTFANTYTFKHSQEVYNASEEMYVTPKQLLFTDPKNIQIAIIKNYKKWRPGLGNAVIDIFCKYKYNSELYWMAFGKEYKMAYRPLEDGFKEISFYGVKCLIPIAYDKYLSGHYGEWKTPNETWDQKDSNAMINEYKEEN